MTLNMNSVEPCQVPKWVGEPDSVEPKPNPTPFYEYQMCQIFNLLYSEKKMTGRCFVGGCNLIWDKLVTLPIPLPPTAIERFPGSVSRISKTKSKAKKTCSAFQETNFKQYLFETKTYFLSKIYYSSQAIAVKVLHHSLLRQLLCLHTFTFTMAGARKSDNYYASKL